ncbi:MAG: hypothetical protein A2655_03770 [Candidatus Yanofskybacteria bacterium RIFCSPHIGHO2_01_FULL_43_42]|uniref:Uncharacterized protein n=1 Tax=Candidatus Yanofskybacteria bacterium RIFCSPLOWO2_01_FULL_43_22 TaxID=1802695 RepID=A0A1F8GH55_9BACT|nr:MAG: hypothetical protein A2655_03770 [Candidatus Yanofskybacteria bacterium RIFCSPHIGHO2_01_FULL_43_42]OGN12904.1 MAG: hypothetical protein A3D48_03255 [Candidatus Yanofskybacteria bacterium RIFCSPHIGHO2_02_FULL_43_17]OGN24016.1 MAG: hypothetical protein A3A13_03010 [Candidatus Yanofskybacteria bacterium RIFCSPLOWO2_01_FULL_43_22]
MFKSITAGFFVVAMSLVAMGCDSLSGYSPTSPSLADSSGNLNETSSIKEAVGDVAADLEDPKTINGVEFATVRGWLANIYPWEYVPEQSTVHPVSRLWNPRQQPSPFQVSEQCRQIREFGGGAAVLEYSPNPRLGWHNYWLSTGFANGCGPFFLLYEHINGTRFIPVDGGPKDMSNPYNRQVFKDDIDFMFRNVIVPYQSRYVAVNGRAVIYLWSSVQMTGDFASLLEEVKNEYPIFFIGSGEMWSAPRGAEDVARVRALDGFMEYTLGGRSNYLRAVQDYNRASFSWRGYLRDLETKTGKRHLFIPTFQAAYDDTKIIPRRNNPTMYARSVDEVKYHAEMIRSGMGSVYDYLIGPFVVYGELLEGAAVIESQCLAATMDTPGRFVGCGTARLQILKEYFGWR